MKVSASFVSALLFVLSVLALGYGMWALAEPPQHHGMFWLVAGGLGLKSVHDRQRWVGQN